MKIIDFSNDQLHARMEEAADERNCLPQYTKAVNRLDSLIKVHRHKNRAQMFISDADRM